MRILRHVDANDGGGPTTMETVNQFGIRIVLWLVLAGSSFCAGAIIGREMLRHQLRNQLPVVVAEQPAASSEHVHGFGRWDLPSSWSDSYRTFYQGRNCTNCGWVEIRCFPMPTNQ